jgi:flagellar basal-body rod protein FlgC
MLEGLFGSFRISAAGMSAQRKRLDVVAENLANAETTRTPDGGPYRPKKVVFRSTPSSGRRLSFREHLVKLFRSHRRHMPERLAEVQRPVTVGVVVEAQVQEVENPIRVEYDPNHPDADDKGYVRKPNVNVVEQMVEMIEATRAYQANAAAFEAAKDMFLVSLEI